MTQPMTLANDAPRGISEIHDWLWLGAWTRTRTPATWPAFPAPFSRSWTNWPSSRISTCRHSWLRPTFSPGKRCHHCHYGKSKFSCLVHLVGWSLFLKRAGKTNSPTLLSEHFLFHHYLHHHYHRITCWFIIMDIDLSFAPALFVYFIPDTLLIR